MPTFGADNSAEQKPSSGGFLSWFGGGSEQKAVGLPHQFVLQKSSESQHYFEGDVKEQCHCHPVSELPGLC